DDDFAVDEELPYAPSGAGDHVFVRIEKRGTTTVDAARALARALGVRDRDIGIAGMKDRHAVTRQWLSLPPPVAPEQALAVELPRCRACGCSPPTATPTSCAPGTSAPTASCCGSAGSTPAPPSGRGRSWRRCRCRPAHRTGMASSGSAGMATTRRAAGRWSPA